MINLINLICQKKQVKSSKLQNDEYPKITCIMNTNYFNCIFAIYIHKLFLPTLPNLFIFKLKINIFKNKTVFT